MDVITSFSTHYKEWCSCLDASTFSFILRCSWLFGFPCVLGYAVLLQQKAGPEADADANTSRRVSAFMQGVAVLIGVLLALYVRIPEIYDPMAKTVAVTVALMLILSAPAYLPRFLVGAFHIQQRVIWILYFFILFLILLQINGGY